MRFKRLKHLVGGYILESTAALQASLLQNTINQKDYHPFIFFGRGRSGSTLLVEMLNAHPSVTCLGEILRYRTFAPVKYIDNCLNACGSDHRGFKLLSYQVKTLCSPNKQASIRRWLEDNNVTIFHLHRENTLNHAISNIYANRRNVYHSTNKQAKRHNSIHIAPDELLKWMDGSLRLLDFEKEFLDGLKYMNIIYERDLSDAEDQHKTYSAILEQLKLPHHEYTTKLKKVTPPDLKHLIINYAEIEQTLTNTAFEKYLPSK